MIWFAIAMALIFVAGLAVALVIAFRLPKYEE